MREEHLELRRRVTGDRVASHEDGARDVGARTLARRPLHEQARAARLHLGAVVHEGAATQLHRARAVEEHGAADLRGIPVEHATIDENVGAVPHVERTPATPRAVHREDAADDTAPHRRTQEHRAAVFARMVVDEPALIDEQPHGHARRDGPTPGAGAVLEGDAVDADRIVARCPSRSRALPPWMPTRRCVLRLRETERTRRPSRAWWKTQMSRCAAPWRRIRAARRSKISRPIPTLLSALRSRSEAKRLARARHRRARERCGNERSFRARPVTVHAASGLRSTGDRLERARADCSEAATARVR